MSDLEELKHELSKISSYPNSLRSVCCEINGIGFFPGAKGLWNVHDETLSNKSFMILGHDFGNEKDFDISVKRGDENLQGLTWKNLLKMLMEYNIDVQDCFFTNGIMGVRINSSAIGKSPGFDDPTFLNDCRNLFLKQIEVQKPKIILALGQHIWKFLSEVSDELQQLNDITTFSDLDTSECTVFKNISFKNLNSFSTNIGFLTHPTYWHLNVKNRRYKSFQGIEAERQMIKSLFDDNTLSKSKTENMNSGDFVLYKIEPNEMEISGEVNLDRNSHGRLFLNCIVELSGNSIIFRSLERQSIEGIFSLEKYYVLKYDDR